MRTYVRAWPHISYSRPGRVGVCARAPRRYRPSFSSDDHLHLRLLCALTFGIFSLETLGSTRLDSRDWVLGA